MNENVRTRKEIVDKIEEIYELIKLNKMEAVRGILYTDALSYALGEDYLDFEYLKEEENGNN